MWSAKKAYDKQTKKKCELSQWWDGHEWILEVTLFSEGPTRKAQKRTEEAEGRTNANRHRKILQ